MIYIKVCDNLYPAEINGRVADRDWDNRASKYIKLKMGVAEAMELFKDGVEWAIVEAGTTLAASVDDEGNVVFDNEGELIYEETEFRHEYDNREYCVLGDIVIHPDGTCTVAMGKETTEEKLITMMYGGVE